MDEHKKTETVQAWLEMRSDVVLKDIYNSLHPKIDRKHVIETLMEEYKNEAMVYHYLTNAAGVLNSEQ